MAASSIAASLLIAGAILRWEHMPLRIQRIIPWVILTYVIIAYGSAEIAWSENPVPQGYRVVLLMLNLLGLIIALLFGFADKDYEQDE